MVANFKMAVSTYCFMTEQVCRYTLFGKGEFYESAWVQTEGVVAAMQFWNQSSSFFLGGMRNINHTGGNNPRIPDAIKLPPAPLAKSMTTPIAFFHND